MPISRVQVRRGQEVSVGIDIEPVIEGQGGEGVHTEAGFGEALQWGGGWGGVVEKAAEGGSF